MLTPANPEPVRGLKQIHQQQSGAYVQVWPQSCNRSERRDPRPLTELKFQHDVSWIFVGIHFDRNALSVCKYFPTLLILHIQFLLVYLDITVMNVCDDFMLKVCVWSPWNVLKCDIVSATPSEHYTVAGIVLSNGGLAGQTTISYAHECSKIYKIDSSIFTHMPSYSPAKCRSWLARGTILRIFFQCSMLFAQSRICAILKSTRNVSSNIWRKTRNKYM